MKAMASFLIIPLFAGQVNVKLKKNTIFSERYGQVPTITIGPLRFTWRKWR